MRCVLFALLTACGFSQAVDAPLAGELVTLTDDALAAGTVRGGVVTGGHVEPDGFVLGGLHARGYQAGLVDAGEDITKVFADAAAAAPIGAGYAQVPTNWAAARPKGLGLIASDLFSVAYDGEILLPKGEITLQIDADDRAIVEVLGVESTTALALTVPEPGWYPIRAAISEDGGAARLLLTIVEGQIATPVDGNRLRARVTDAPGVLVYAWDLQGFVGERGHTWRPSLDDAFSVAAPPYDLTASIDRFSLRFAGQLRIDTAGTYTFGATLGVDTNDGFRLWIDGELVAHHWLGHPDVPTADLQLDAGWHSILLDYADEIGNAEVHVTMNGAPIDPAQLRPVVVFGNTVTFANVQAPVPIVDAASTLLPLPLGGTEQTLIDAVDVGFRIDNQDMTTVALTLFDCTSGGRPLVANPTPSYHYFPADKTCAGLPTNPLLDWTLRIDDTAPGNGIFPGPGQVRDYGVAALYHGGPAMPFAPVFAYTSPAQPTPGAQTIDAVRVMGSFDDAFVEVAVRSGADPATLEAAPFELVREGIRYAASELVQYRVTISSDGWHFPVLDRVEIDYVTTP